MRVDKQSRQLDFSAIMASSVHDMKNAIQMLLGTLDEVVDESSADKSSHDKILRAQAEGRRINDQLVQLLTLYKAGNAACSIRSIEQDVSEFFEELYLESGELLGLRGIELIVECEEYLQWFFDHELLKGVVNNLITNAQQHTRDKIFLKAEIKENELLISVADNGAGYAENWLIADSREQSVVPSDNSGEHSGTGLGLFFSATIAHMHRNRERSGYLTMTNNGIDGGACCTIVLP